MQRELQESLIQQLFGNQVYFQFLFFRLQSNFTLSLDWRPLSAVTQWRVLGIPMMSALLLSDSRSRHVCQKVEQRAGAGIICLTVII